MQHIVEEENTETRDTTTRRKRIHLTKMENKLTIVRKAKGRNDSSLFSFLTFTLHLSKLSHKSDNYFKWKAILEPYKNRWLCKHKKLGIKINEPDPNI